MCAQYSVDWRKIPGFGYRQVHIELKIDKTRIAVQAKEPQTGLVCCGYDSPMVRKGEALEEQSSMRMFACRNLGCSAGSAVIVVGAIDLVGRYKGLLALSINSVDDGDETVPVGNVRNVGALAF